MILIQRAKYCANHCYATRCTKRMVMALLVAGQGLFISSLTLAAEPLNLYTPDLAQFPNASASSPRIITLTHGANKGVMLATYDNGNTFTVTDGSGEPPSFIIYRSADSGTTWSQLSVVSDQVHDWKFAQQPMLFEVPEKVGGSHGLKAGTILLVGNYEETGVQDQDLEVYESTDAGKTWSYLSSCVTGGASGHGTWEPYLQVDADGNLDCYFSDERQNSSGFSQVIGHVVSTDGGRTWEPEIIDVGIADGVTRPGMAAIASTYSGQYVMAFETVGETDSQVHIKFSADGTNWGDTSDLGTLVATADGHFLGATPELIAIPPTKKFPSGELVLAAKAYFDEGGYQSPATGNVLLVNTTGGTGVWERAPAPMGLNPTPTLSPDCNNYKPGLAWTGHGSHVVELAPQLIAPNVCRIVYAEAKVLPANQDASVAATAVGPDGRPWVLWRYADGQIALWALTSDGSSLLSSTNFASQGEWVIAGFAIGNDNNPRLLWNNTTNGKAAIWTLSQTDDSQKRAYEKDLVYKYNAPAGTIGRKIAVGPDNNIRLLWSGASGQAALWTLSADAGQILAATTFPIFQDWIAADLSVGTDNEPRLLWNNASGAIALWTQTADGSSTLYNNQYGPFLGTSALSIASGPDNQIRVLWSATDGHINLWTMDSYASTLISNNAYGPFSGTNAISLSIGGNNEPRILWTSTGDFMDFWTMSSDGSTLLFNYSGTPL